MGVNDADFSPRGYFPLQHHIVTPAERGPTALHPPGHPPAFFQRQEAQAASTHDLQQALQELPNSPEQLTSPVATAQHP